MLKSFITVLSLSVKTMVIIEVYKVSKSLIDSPWLRLTGWQSLHSSPKNLKSAILKFMFGNGCVDKTCALSYTAVQ